MWLLIVLGWLSCALLGGVVASWKEAGNMGFLLGLLFGPLGLIDAFALDDHMKCPACGGRINDAARKCQHCGETIARRG